MKTLISALTLTLFSQFLFAQNVGIGVPVPGEKLEVNGNIKANTIKLTQGSQYSSLKKGVGDAVVFEKDHKALGLNYIIATTGQFPNPGPGTNVYTNQIIGEIRLFAGNFAPSGFAFCNGQLLAINTNVALFNLLGTTYGGNGLTTFALPDLRGAVPVHFGTPAAGGENWDLGEKN